MEWGGVVRGPDLDDDVGELLLQGAGGAARGLRLEANALSLTPDPIAIPFGGPPPGGSRVGWSHHTTGSKY